MPTGKVKLKASPPTTIRIKIAKQARGTWIIPAFIVEQTLPSYESNWLNWFPITPLQALAVSPNGMQERLSDPTLAGGDIQPSPHQAAVLGAPIQMAQKPLPSYESKGFQITALEVVLFGLNDVKERAPLVEGSMGG